VDVRVDLREFGSGQERHQELSVRLAKEIRVLDVSVTPAHAEHAADGRRALAGLNSALVVGCRPTRDQLSDLVSAVRDWLRRSPTQRTVKVTVDGDSLELTGAAGERHRADVETWITRHADADTGAQP
jgi:hypothetical protein